MYEDDVIDLFWKNSGKEEYRNDPTAWTRKDMVWLETAQAALEDPAYVKWKKGACSLPSLSSPAKP